MDDLSFPDDARDDAARDGEHDCVYGDEDYVNDGGRVDGESSYADYLAYDGYYDVGVSDHDYDDDAHVDGTVAARRALGRSLDDPPPEITVIPGSIYATYERYARACYDCCSPISPAEVILEMTGLRLGPFDRELLASLVCARVAEGAISGIDPAYRALASRVVQTHATTGATDGLAYLLDPSFVTLAGIEWAGCAGARIAEELPEICHAPLQPDLPGRLEPLLDEAVKTSVSLRACYGGYRWPRSLPEAAIAGLGVMERAGLGLGSTSVASLVLLGTGATRADLPPSAFSGESGDTGASDTAEQFLAEWHEEQHAFLVGELLDNGLGNGDPDPDSDSGEDPVLLRIGLLGPVLGHRPARRAELEALLGSLPWLFDLHVIPASSFIRRRDAELDRAHRESGELEDLGEEQLDDDHHGSDADGGHLSSRSCAVCRKAAGPADDTDEVVLARDERLCLDVLLAHLLRRITAEGAVLGDHDRSVLSRLVVAATEDVLDAMQLCARLRLELATGEVLGPPDIMGLSDTRLSTCVLASDEIAVSEIVRDIVTGLYELIDDELVGIYLDALRRLGPAPSPSGWGVGERS